MARLARIVVPDDAHHVMQRRSLHPDHQGSIAGISQGTGTLLTVNRYDEYGIPAATNLGRFQYTGQAWLHELGMYYYKARIYSPTLGRFMQTDPIGYEDQINLYAYARNDPFNLSDPSGEETPTTCEGITATCEVTSQTGATFTGSNALDDANRAVAVENARLVAETGFEYGNVFEENSDGSITVSVSVSNNSETNVTAGIQELVSLTDNPRGDQHVHRTPSEGSYDVLVPAMDVNAGDIQATIQDSPYRRTIVDGPTGAIISFEGRPGSMRRQADGNYVRREGVSDTFRARLIGSVPPIPARR